jgi:hypothetical protein
MLRLTLVIVTLATVACTSAGERTQRTLPAPFIVHVTAEPQIGDPAPPGFERSRQGTLAGPSQLYPSFTARHGRVEFEVGVANDGLVAYVSTDDRDFATPEGVRAGKRFSRLLRDGAEVIKEPGWGCHVGLDSGWHAATAIGGLQCDSKVIWLFKRR